MLRSQPIKAPRVSTGEYYSVMSRHTLNDGVTPDRDIACAPEQHLKVLAPPDTLVGDWYRGCLGERNEETFQGAFRDRYLAYIDQTKAAQTTIYHLGVRALEADVTLMCIEESVTSGELLLCHRRLLLEYATEIIPQLTVDIR